MLLEILGGVCHATVALQWVQRAGQTERSGAKPGSGNGAMNGDPSQLMDGRFLRDFGLKTQSDLKGMDAFVFLVM